MIYLFNNSILSIRVSKVHSPRLSGGIRHFNQSSNPYSSSFLQSGVNPHTVRFVDVVKLDSTWQWLSCCWKWFSDWHHRSQIDFASTYEWRTVATGFLIGVLFPKTQTEWNGYYLSHWKKIHVQTVVNCRQKNLTRRWCKSSQWLQVRGHRRHWQWNMGLPRRFRQMSSLNLWSLRYSSSLAWATAKVQIEPHLATNSSVIAFFPGQEPILSACLST